MDAQKIESAHKIISEDGFYKLILIGIATVIPDYILNQGRLILNERAFATRAGNNNWVIRALPTLQEKRRIPSLSETLSGIHLGSPSHQAMLEEIYTFENFVKVDEGDVVVDTGAYIGGFSLYAIQYAEMVVAIDPFAAINGCLESNLSGLSNCCVIPMAAWNESDTLSIELSTRPSKNTVLQPKTGETGTSFDVEADTIPELCSAEGIEQVDYLKVEAEGVEPEIMNGVLAGEMNIQKIAVDAGPERYGDSVKDEIISLLEEHGYQCRVKDNAQYWGNNIVFARKTQ